VVVILAFLTGFSGLAALDRLALLVQHNTLAPGLVQAFGILAGQSVSDHHPRATGSRTGSRGGGRASLQRCMPASRQARSGPTLTVKALAAEIIAMMDSLQMRWLVDPDEIDMAAVFHHYIQSVRRAIGVGLRVPRHGRGIGDSH
jgi:hypothetical protein